MDDDGDYSYFMYNYENDYDNDSFAANASVNVSFSVECHSTRFRGSDVFLPLWYCLIFFTGFFGNLFVISVVGGRGGRGGRLVDTFVVNLALADLVFVLTLPLWAVSVGQGGRWDFGPAGDLLCKLSSYVIAVNRFSNIFFLTCMSVDRYLAIVKLMDSRYLRSSRCVRATCAAVWAVSLALAVPSLVYRNVTATGDGLSCVEDNSSAFFLGMSLTMALLTFVIPVLVIVLCYGSIVAHLNKHCATAGNPRAEARRRHSLKMVLCIIVAFVASWLPFNLFKAILIISHLSNTDVSCAGWLANGLLVSCCLAFLNSCVNPFIYFFLDRHFRRRAGVLYLACVGRAKSAQSYNSSASVTNAGTSESFATSGGRSRLQSLQRQLEEKHLDS